MSFHGNYTAAADLHRPGVQSNTDPGAIGAYKLWIDTGIDGTTSAPVVKVRDGADGAWVVLGLGATFDISLPFVLDGGGVAITTGVKGDVEIPFGGTISAARLFADQTGSIVVDLWKDTYANFPPTVADTITASAKPTLSSATKAEDTTLTGWTTSVAAGDIIRVNVDSATTVTRVTLSLTITRSI